MTLRELLTEASRLGAAITADGANLRVEAPKGSLDPQFRAALAEHKTGLLNLLRQRDGAGRHDIAHASCDGPLPLSLAQQRLWLLQRIEPDPALYHVAGAAWLDGALDRDALAAALLQIARRHEALRTTFVEIDGTPMQRIGEARFPVAFHDFSAAGDSEIQAGELAAAIVQTPFDLEEGPLVRAALVRTAPDRHLFLLCLHHIVADAWSIAILLKELASLYGNGDPSLPTLPLQYADFSVWQRGELSGPRLEELLRFWKDRLTGVPETLDLPFDRPREDKRSSRGGMVRSAIGRQTADSLRALARKEQATLFQLLLTAFQILLYRCTGQDSFAIGTPVANRSRAEIEPLIGFFVNTIVLRARLAGDPTFGALLQRVKAETIEAYEHESLPFELLVSEMRPARSLNRNPLFQVMFALQNVPPGSPRMGSVKITPTPVDAGVSKFDLYLSLAEQADGSIAAEWEYAADLFDRPTIDRLSGHFSTLLEAIAADPGRLIGRLPLLSSGQADVILHGWNDTAAAWPESLSLVDLLAAQRDRSPEAIAVVDRQSRLTYAALDRRSNQVAHALRALGVEPEARIGIKLRRGCEMIAALLGVLKAGAAYVPLDPAYPEERLRFLMEDAGTRIVVTERALAQHGAHELLLEDTAAEPDTPLPLAIGPQQLAYLIYTSGSTGKPKGILIEHRNAVSMLAWARSVYSPEDLRGTLAATSLCFDLSVFEIFLPLIAGGTVIVAEDALDLAGHPAAAEVTLVNTVPSAAAELVRGGHLPPSVRVINLAGEPLRRALADSLYALPHINRVYDLYGPGETTTYSTYALRARGGAETVGRPISNTRLYILDAHLQPVPVGAPGEIYIAGAGVTRGYLNRDELTRERYVNDPFAPGRMYRTGDLGRFDPSGNVRFLGRLDHQVKIRGFRVEPGEVDQALSLQPGVTESVTTADGEADSKRLITYYTGAASEAELRGALGQSLPAFMLPARFLRLDALPRTPNGKIDRHALPAPDRAPLDAEPAIAPRTAEESAIHGVWVETLRIERIGIHDNFFALGGDSIRAMQVSSRLRACGFPMQPRDLFEHQTIAALASISWRDRAAPAGPAIESGTLPLTAIQRWGLRGDPATAHHYNQWVLLEAPANLTPASLRTAFAAIVERHGALRLRFRHTENGWTASYGPSGGALEFHVSDAADAAAEMERAQSALNLETGPISRAVWFPASDGPPRLFWTIHHLAVDAVSWQILLTELAALASGTAPPPRTATYQQWSNQLAARGETPIAVCETGAGTVADTLSCHGELDVAETGALIESVALAYQARVDDALLGSLGRALARFTGRTEQQIAMETHGRDRLDDLDVTRTVGWFTGIRTVALRVAADAATGDLLPGSKQARRAPGGSDVPSVSFNFLGEIGNWALAGHGISEHPARRRPYPLAFEASIANRRLRWRFEYSARHQSQGRIEALSADFAATLRALIAHCGEPGAGRYIPSDFPGAELTQAGLDALVQSNPRLFHRNIEAIRPANAAQQGILFHAELGAADGVYLTQAGVRLEGAFHASHFEYAWREVTARHAALRTCFARDRHQNPAAVVLRRAAMEILEAAPASGWDELLASDRRRGMDRSAAPLSRLTLIRRSEFETDVLWTFHHAVLDGWSLAIVLREVAAAYRARLTGEPVRLEPLPPPLAAPPDTAAALEFWRQEMAAWDTPTVLPFDRSQPLTGQGRQECAIELDAPEMDRVRQFLTRHHLTLHTLLQGAWAVLLARLGGCGEVMFGSAVSGRAHASSGTGLLMRSVPARIGIAANARLSDWLSQLQTAQARREEHAHLPLVDIQGMASLPSGAALFETLLVLENYPVDSAIQGKFGDLTATGVRVVERPHYPLTLIASGEEKLNFTAVYDRNRLEPGDVQRLLALYRHLLLSFLDAPLTRLRDLELSGAETGRQVRDWNGTGRHYPLHQSVPDWIEAQARRTPGAIAVVFERETLTYREFDRRANGVAHLLLERGVRPGTLVGVRMERSLELPVALTGILKAGAAYVPVDPGLPEARRNAMLADCGASIVLDAAQVRGAAGRDEPPPRSLHPASAAYMIYTSGSTGAPKGAINTHAGLLNRLLWMQEAFALGPDEAVLQKTPFSFDVSVWEFLWPLMVGARLVMARPGGHLDRDYLVDSIRSHQITTLHFVPSMLRIFLDAKELSACRSLRRVIASGEALAPDLAARFHARLPAELHNLYGPTEAAVDVSWYACPRGPAESGIPIGRPIANTQLYVLDRECRPMPQGVPGELHIGGVQVGRGYWNRPDLTAERFIPNPFGEGRLYRTGDLCRYLADGNIEYLGRLDQQVKIRGVRIELGEIEAVLRAHPAVADAVAVACRDRDDTSLAAYFTAARPGLTPAELSRHARAHLPEAMIPSWFLPLEEIPRLSSGKIDRRALPEPRTQSPPARAAALTAIERAIADAWKEVLGAEPAAADQNFFDLGGHSLKLMRVHGRLQDVYGTRLTLLDLFEHPTISSLARHIGGFGSGPAPAPAPVPRQAGPGPFQIAIVGMACRFPGAENPEQFWANLAAGRESIHFFSDEELRAAGETEARLRDPKFVRAHGSLDGADCFDAAFFDVPPSEAEILDPQQRVFLEVAWETFERAGYDPARMEGPVAVFAGAGLNTYALTHLHSRPGVLAGRGPVALMISSDKDYLPTRVSYKLNLTGPSISVQTACSTSLVAVSMACESLLRGDCRAALAGGVSIRFPQAAGHLHEEGMMFSSDGRCRPFDAASQGTVAGSGAGAVLLKRLEDAQADGDHIHAVIQAAAVNNDGSSKAGYTAPGVEGQTTAISTALERSGISPETIGYVEAHGTATPLGDPIEIAALTRAYRRHTPATGFCAIGSVKSNIGHLDAAAGIAGLIKTVLAVEHGAIPASLHFERPNPHIDFESSPFTVASRLTPWPAKDTPRRAAVSSFGLGGTNAHVIVEQAERAPAGPSRRTHHLLTLSARSPEALGRARHRLADALEAGAPLAEAAYTLATGRREFAHRLAVVCRTAQEAAQILRGSEAVASLAAAAKPIVFVYPGIVEPGAGQGLYACDDAFRQAIDRCAEILRPHFDLHRALWEAPAYEKASLLALEFACTEMWRAWGVIPVAAIAEGTGAYAAACLTGALRIEEALPLLAQGGPLDPPLIADSAHPGAYLLAAAPGETHPLHTAAQLWTAGVPINLAHWYKNERHVRIPLPSYPFERTRHVIPPERPPAAADFLWAPGWQSASVPLPPSGTGVKTWLVLGPGAEAASLMQELRTRGENAVHSATADLPAQPFDAILNLCPADGFYRLLALGQALAARPRPLPCLLVNLTQVACRVTGEDSVDPYRAMAAAALRVLEQEDEHVRTLAVDFDRWSPRLARQIVDEARAGGAEALVAYRQGRRWVRRFAAVESRADGHPALHDRGVYLITGGLTGVGFEIAQEIAASVRSPHLILLSRTATAPSHSPAIESLRAAGAQVDAFPGDAADAATVRSLFETLDARGVPIDGVFHAAGIPGGGTVRLKKREACEAEFAAKVAGTQNLHERLRHRPKAFLLLCSSMSAISGGFGAVAYTAACAFQDAFAEAMSSPDHPVLSVNWSRWREVGMAVAVERLHREVSGEPLTGGITAAKGREALRRVLSRLDLERLAVSPADPLTEERATRRFLGLADTAAGLQRAESPGDTESVVAAVWRSVLGLEEIPPGSTFASLGGDSLLALRALDRLRRQLSIQLPVRVVFEESTIEALARHIDAIRWAQQPARAAAAGGFESGVL